VNDIVNPVLLAAAGAAVVVDISGPGLPRVLHWGGDPGPVTADELRSLFSGVDGAPLVPTQWDGWLGRPGVTGDRSGRWPHLRPRLIGTPTVDRAARSVEASAVDEVAGIRLTTRLRLSEHGVVQLRHTMENIGDDEWTVGALRCLLPLPDRGAELLDLTGRWGLERVPQRHAFGHGTHARENRRGRTGHDATLLLVAGTPGFGFREGEVWAVHTGWSGDHETYAERISGAFGVLGGAELLEPGELRLAPGETYSTPDVYCGWSDAGLDGLSDRLHRMIRARPSHPRSPRPLTLNVWEAVYFDHDLEKLRALADRAAKLGAERYVLDDGWFRGRRDDSAGLGDWEVDPTVWPQGLHPLVDHVRSLDMQFGLWFEPEMVNPDSELARAHPDWFLAALDRLPRPSRQQQVLNLARPEVSEYLYTRIDALIREYGLAYIKWDHNRDLLEADPDGHAGVHRQTMATYALLDRLRAAHPGLEIESCSSGGARADLGILARTDRVWTSDSDDALDRQRIQRWTGLLLPPELLGAHVGPSPAHLTRRATPLEFRCATALVAHAGIEWDITECTEDEMASLAEWAALYRRTRELIHTGRTVRVDIPHDPTAHLYGVVGHDDRWGLFVYARLDSALASRPAAVALPGLDPTMRYRVTRCWGAGVGLGPDGVELSGAALGRLGIALPPLKPGEAAVLELTAV
jgi:alpha-galactosidase